MQNAFWKTVTILGVVGIGSLVVVEVQNRLRKLPTQSAALDEAAGDDIGTVPNGGGDVEMDAALTQSPFERRFAAENSPTASFDLSEPDNHLHDHATTAGNDSEQVAAAFYGADGNAGAAGSVDNTVRRENLAEGSNPFEAFERSTNSAASTADSAAARISTTAADAQAVADSFQFPTMNRSADTVASGVVKTASAAVVQPAGHEGDDPFAEDGNFDGAAAERDPFAGGSAQPDPFSFDAEPVAFDDEPPAPASEVPAARSDNIGFADFSEEQPNSVPVPREIRGDSQPQPARSSESPMLYFGANGDDSPSDLPMPETSAPSSAPAELKLEPFVPDSDPRLEPSAVNPAHTPDRINLQPVPERQPATLDTPDAELPNGGFFSDDESEPARGPDRSTQPTGSGTFDDDAALPFVEDPASADDDRSPVPVPRQVPSAREDSSLTLPGFDDRIPPRNDFGEDDRNPVRVPDADGRGSQPFDDRDFDDAPAFNDFPAFDDRDVPAGTAPGRRPSNPADLDWSAEPAEPRPVDSLDSRDRRGLSPRLAEPVDATRQVSAVMRPHLTVRKNAPENATVGIPVPYTIIVRNEGQSPAYDVVVEDELPAAADLKGARPTPEFDQRSRRLTWLFESLPPGEERQIEVTIVPTGEGTLAGVATVQFKAQVKATTVIRAPRLELQLTGPPEVRIGDKVDYRYVITNRGTGEARDVFVRTVLPAGLQHPEGGDLEYEISSMRPDEQREIVLTVVAADPGQYRTVAEATALGGAKAQAGSPISVVGQQLQLERRGAKRRFVGRAATYENIIQNETTFDAFDAEVIEQIPDGMKFVSASDSGLYNPQDRTVVWKIAQLPAGKQKLLQIELTPLMAGEQRSIVTVVENAGFRNEVDHTTSVQDLHNVSADISNLDGPVAVGETFGFSISIDNRGTADATDVELVVQVPRGIKIVGAGSPDKPAFPADNNSARYDTILRIPPGQQESFELRLQGQQPVQNGAVKALVRYRQMQEPLVVSESVTVYSQE